MGENNNPLCSLLIRPFAVFFDSQQLRPAIRSADICRVNAQDIIFARLILPWRKNQLLFAK
jgi:hypothetical protein